MLRRLATAASPNHVVKSQTDHIHQLLAAQAPFFPHTGGVAMIDSPRAFHSTLLRGIAKSRRRIVMSSLYLGCDSLSQEVVDALVKAKTMHRELDVTIMLDAMRSSRLENGSSSSVTLLKPLLAMRGVDVYLYHSPSVTGVYERHLPPRWNELPGVHHIKLNLFDDDVLMTGANLSENYFTNRRDRYMLLKQVRSSFHLYHSLTHEKNALLGDHYDRLFNRLLTAFAHRLAPKSAAAELMPANYRAPHTHRRIEQLFDVILQPCESGVNAVSEPKKFRQKLHAALSRFIADELESSRDAYCELPWHASQTWLFSSLQFGNCGFTHDSTLLRRFLEHGVHHQSALTLTSPYLNLSPSLLQRVLQCPTDQLTLLTASPRANGFFTARGASRRVPAAYVLMERQVWQAAAQQCKQFALYEYEKAGWTYHAKGLWYAPTTTSDPIVSLIGSANFGARSMWRDSEAQLTIVTRDASLRAMLAAERDAIVADSRLIDNKRFLYDDKDHYVPLWVHLVGRAARALF